MHLQPPLHGKQSYTVVSEKRADGAEGGTLPTSEALSRGTLHTTAPRAAGADNAPATAAGRVGRDGEEQAGSKGGWVCLCVCIYIYA